MCKVSIIVPIYNASKYLDECMESILSQTLTDIEVICINDGSTDDSERILDKYEKIDSRIKVIDKKNSGYGDSVNQGIDMAKGKYIGIVEPDDYISLEMYEKLLEVAERFDLDIAKGNFAGFTGDDGYRKYEPQRVVAENGLYEKIFRPRDYKEIFRGGIINPAGIYKKTFLDRHSIRHNITPGASYQDVGFWFQAMWYARKMYLINEIVYYYREDNMLSSTNNKNKVYCICDEYDYIRKKMFQVNRSDDITALYTESMFCGYCYTVYRLDIENKIDFIKRFATDFMMLKTEGMLNMSYLYDDEKQTLSSILYQTEKYIGFVTRQADYYREKLRNIRKAVIYGCGKYGQNLLKNMYSEELKKVVGFAVTNKDGEPDIVQGFAVKEIESYKSENDEIYVLIGTVKEEEYIKNNLRRLGFDKIIPVLEKG